MSQERIKTPILFGVQENENILADDYPVYGDYLYVVDGQVIRSDVFGTVRTCSRVRRCDG